MNHHHPDTKRGDMKPHTAAFLSITMFLATFAAAQIKTVPGDPITVTATISAIDHASRVLTLTSPDGRVTQTTVSTEVRRFDALKVGDIITAKYYDNVILRVMKPGEKPVDSASASLAPHPGDKPSATATAQRSVTATITAIDPSIPSITLVGPDKTTYTHKVADVEALKQVKVGDRLDITWSAAVLISAEAPKPK
jgi:hypothetical protein